MRHCVVYSASQSMKFSSIHHSGKQESMVSSPRTDSWNHANLESEAASASSQESPHAQLEKIFACRETVVAYLERRFPWICSHHIEDAFSDLMTSLHERPSDIPGEWNHSWLAIATRNRAFTSFRTRRPTQSLSSVPEPTEGPDCFLDDVDQHEKITTMQLAQRQLPTLVALLSPIEKDIVQRVIFDGVPDKEYAADVGIHVAQVGRRLKSAVKNLRQLLMKNGVNPVYFGNLSGGRGWTGKRSVGSSRTA